MKKKLSSTMEDYLETIAVLEKENDIARVRDISRLLGVKSSSVNAALRTLSKKGLVRHEKYGYVHLTANGKEIAREIQSRHDMLVKFLTKILNVDEDTALQDACRMEHAISSKTFGNLTRFIEFMETVLDEKKPQWIKSFKHYLETGKTEM